MYLFPPTCKELLPWIMPLISKRIWSSHQQNPNNLLFSGTIQQALTCIFDCTSDDPIILNTRLYCLLDHPKKRTIQSETIQSEATQSEVFFHNLAKLEIAFCFTPKLLNTCAISKYQKHHKDSCGIGTLELSRSKRLGFFFCPWSPVSPNRLGDICWRL